jgi:hypothetical protein
MRGRSRTTHSPGAQVVSIVWLPSSASRPRYYRAACGAIERYAPQPAFTGTPSSVFHGIVGRARMMRRLFEQIGRVAVGSGPVLVLGETGTGKELIARAIHGAGPRADGPFIALNCAALPRELIEAELFGYKRGAFSGALVERPGLFRAATGGTLLLDEVTEMAPELQAKLLRVLQEQTVRPIGAVVEEPIDVRVVASSNRDPARALGTGLLGPIYYRLSVTTLVVPPLRDRCTSHRLWSSLRHCQAPRRPPARPRCMASTAMLARPRGWPGNVRELFNVVDTVRQCTGAASTCDLDLSPSPPGAATRRGPTAASTSALIGRRSRSRAVTVRQRESASRKKLYAKPVTAPASSALFLRRCAVAETKWPARQRAAPRAESSTGTSRHRSACPGQEQAPVSIRTEGPVGAFDRVRRRRRRGGRSALLGAPRPATAPDASGGSRTMTIVARKGSPITDKLRLARPSRCWPQGAGAISNTTVTNRRFGDRPGHQDGWSSGLRRASGSSRTAIEFAQIGISGARSHIFAAPGPAETALFLHPAPIVATFHAAGLSNGYRYLTAPLKKLADNILRLGPQTQGILTIFPTGVESTPLGCQITSPNCARSICQNEEATRTTFATTLKICDPTSGPFLMNDCRRSQSAPSSASSRRSPTAPRRDHSGATCAIRGTVKRVVELADGVARFGWRTTRDARGRDAYLNEMASRIRTDRRATARSTGRSSGAVIRRRSRRRYRGRRLPTSTGCHRGARPAADPAAERRRAGRARSSASWRGCRT